jgi:hypothetical protein
MPFFSGKAINWYYSRGTITPLKNGKNEKISGFSF